MSEPKVLLEEWSPRCNIQAFVEESDTCCYFYLWFNPGTENAYLKSCWICNTVKAPKNLNLDAIQAGEAPVLPEEFINHDPRGIKLNPDALSIIWFEEGDAAALLDNEQIICIIPGWGGYKGFHGYSRYAKGTAPYAWELESAEAVLSARVEKSKKFWEYFDGKYWEEVQDYHLNILENFFGPHEKYFAIDGGKFPAKALVSGSKDGVCYGITVGVSLFPMPVVEQYYQDDLKDFRRIELGFATIAEQQEICMKMYSFMSSISNLPWNEISFLGHGHTIPCNAIDGFVAVWLIDARILSESVSPVYPKFMDDSIELLWLVPLKQEEYDFICSMEAGTQAAMESVIGSMDKLIIFDGEGKIRK